MLDVLEFHCQAVSREARDRETPSPTYLPIDRYLAASLLQKAIRRGETAWALTSAFRLLDIDRAYLWRRLAITLFEDVGLHSPAIAWRLLAFKRAARQLGFANAWPGVALLVEEMCHAGKSQAANHALQLARHDPTDSKSLVWLADWPLGRGLEWARDPARTLPQQVQAVWTLSGFRLGRKDKSDCHPDASAGVGWRLAFALVSDQDLIRLAQLGAETGSPLLAIAAALAASMSMGQLGQQTTAPDAMPPASILCGLPSWAFDMYTRPGILALAQTTQTCPNIRAALEALPNQRNQTLGNVHFEHESACLSRRVLLPPELALHQRCRLLAARPLPDSQPVFEALKRDWDLFLHRELASVVAGHFRR